MLPAAGSAAVLAQIAGAQRHALRPAVFGKALFRERVCRSVLLHAEKRERRLTREQERAEQPRAAAEVAHALAALRRGEPAEREAVGRRREELRIKIKAGAALPEKVLAFHEASVP